VNAINTKHENTTDAPHSGTATTDVEHVHSVLEHTCPISYMAVTAEVGISSASMFCTLLNTWDVEYCAKWTPMTTTPCVYARACVAVHHSFPALAKKEKHVP
jgi:hypothetical protein